MKGEYWVLPPVWKKCGEPDAPELVGLELLSGLRLGDGTIDDDDAGDDVTDDVVGGDVSSEFEGVVD